MSGVLLLLLVFHLFIYFSAFSSLVFTANVISKPRVNCFSDKRSDLLEGLSSHKGRNHFL
jgi:hypothetical protein